VTPQSVVLTMIGRYCAMANPAIATADKRTLEDPDRHAGPVGAWTILSFSVPESRRKERHLLRRRLSGA
jgi:hypothetical protein